MSPRTHTTTARAVVALAAVVLLLSGCTLVSSLAQPGGQAETGATSQDGATPATTTEPDEDVGSTPEPSSPGTETVDVPVSIGTPVSIQGADGGEVGLFTVTSVVPYAMCPNPDADESKYGMIVIVSVDIMAAPSLSAQTDPYYGQHFDLSKLDVVDPKTGTSTKGGPDYDCLTTGDRLTTVQPGGTASGRLAFDVEDESFAIRWFYGHQNFVVAPSEWGWD